MHKYILTFSKTGTICYTSHLDMMKMFKRAFKRLGIRLSYSRGFNPHPKMGFAQPLSLGYMGLEELLEFETEEAYACDHLMESLRQIMPPGLEVLNCRKNETQGKTLAARTEAAEYVITIPLDAPMEMTASEMEAAYMEQEQILALKKQKKKKELTEIDIKPMIRSVRFEMKAGTLSVKALLDSGSTSNLSPELVIATLLQALGIDQERSAIQVTRTKIIFQ